MRINQAGVIYRNLWLGICLFLLLVSSLWADAGVKIQQVWPEKLINRKNSEALITTTLINYADTNQELRLVCELVTGLDDIEVLYDGKILIPGGDIIKFPVKFNTGNREWGALVRATVFDSNNKEVARADEVLGISDNFYKISPVCTFIHSSGYRNPEWMKLIAIERRKFYWPLVEYLGLGQTPWALCQWGVDAEKWLFAGRFTETKAGVTAFIQTAHQQGLGIVFYNHTGLCGPAGADFAREHPEWLGYVNAKPVYYNLNVEAMDKLRNPGTVDDATREAISEGVMTWTNPLWTDQSAMDFAADQIIQLSKYWDLDGIRWDGYPMLMPGTTVEGSPDMTGATNYQGVPMDSGISDIDDWNEKNIIRLNKRVRKALPNYIFGTNFSPEYMGIVWPRKMPKTFRACVQGGMAIDEDLQTRNQGGSANPANPWETYRQRIVRGADFIREAGGYDSVSTLVSGSPVFNRHMLSIIYAGSASLGIYPGSEPQFGEALEFYRFALRYSELLYNLNIKRIKDVDKAPVLKISSDKPLWWKEYVYKGKLTNGKEYLFVSLVNPPVKPYLDYTETEKPGEQNSINIEVNQRIAGKVKKAYLLSPEITDNKVELKIEDDGKIIKVIVPKLGYWDIVLFEL